ncbi:MAG: hypothetical protein A2X28_04880 [Elusimicrobia bacterium GWA2_56_46]|nr:MAG: hypothetical protein A2X28_04880 [Elusimicrobia bacterium GWA2_56_46]OGR56206.1 MAG: hypothetical protein A2X39_08300 [Elusimicrobia bacterium GWC2_56_31]HBB66965.1 hypothetical protein [Elusimicrobiota bacterium]
MEKRISSVAGLVAALMTGLAGFGYSLEVNAGLEAQLSASGISVPAAAKNTKTMEERIEPEAVVKGGNGQTEAPAVPALERSYRLSMDGTGFPGEEGPAYLGPVGQYFGLNGTITFSGDVITRADLAIHVMGDRTFKPFTVKISDPALGRRPGDAHFGMLITGDYLKFMGYLGPVPAEAEGGILGRYVGKKNIVLTIRANCPTEPGAGGARKCRVFPYRSGISREGGENSYEYQEVFMMGKANMRLTPMD